MSWVLTLTGRAGFWSAAPSPSFEAVMNSVVWVWLRGPSTALGRRGKAPHYTLYMAGKSAAALAG